MTNCISHESTSVIRTYTRADCVPEPPTVPLSTAESREEDDLQCGVSSVWTLYQATGNWKISNELKLETNSAREGEQNRPWCLISRIIFIEMSYLSKCFKLEIMGRRSIINYLCQSNFTSQLNLRFNYKYQKIINHFVRRIKKIMLKINNLYCENASCEIYGKIYKRKPIPFRTLCTYIHSKTISTYKSGAAARMWSVTIANEYLHVRVSALYVCVYVRV